MNRNIYIGADCSGEQKVCIYNNTLYAQAKNISSVEGVMVCWKVAMTFANELPLNAP